MLAMHDHNSPGNSHPKRSVATIKSKKEAGGVHMSDGKWHTVTL